MKKNILLLIIMNLFAVSVMFSEVLSSAERQALIDIYNATNGDNWEDNTGWKTNGEFTPSGTEENWYGVLIGNVLHENGDYEYGVRSIIMPYNNLNGSLGNFDWRRFPLMHTLNLSHNTISGELSDFSALPRRFLTSIYLNHNSISGSINKTDGSSKLPIFVNIITLNNNQITGTINENFSININPISQIDLSHNQLVGDIVCPANGIRWSSVNLSYNQLTGPIPGNLLSMASNPSFLNLSNNLLTGNIPAELCEYTSLTYLGLAGNKLSGNIPENITNLINLADYAGLNISYNMLYTHDSTISNFLNQKQISSTSWYYTQLVLPDNIVANWSSDGYYTISWNNSDNYSYYSGMHRIEYSYDGETWDELARYTDLFTNSHVDTWDGQYTSIHFKFYTIASASSNNPSILISEPYEFSLFPSIWSDSFGTNQGWILNGCFAIGTPTMNNVCNTAHSETNILATNLDGNYLPNAYSDNQNVAISPVFNCTGNYYPVLEFWSFSQFEGTGRDVGTVKISVNNEPWITLETVDFWKETAWTKHWLKLANYAANEANVRIMFSYNSDATLEYTGWNIDDVSVVQRVPMSGTYSVNPTISTSRNYRSLNSAINAINATGASGHVVFNVQSGITYHENLLPLNVLGESSKTVTFQKFGTGNNPLVMASGDLNNPYDFGFHLKGADYVTWDGINLECEDNNCSYGILISNDHLNYGASYNTIKNTNITGFNNGVFVWAVYNPLTASATNSDNTFDNLSIFKTQNGIYFNNAFSTTPTTRDYNNTVKNCTIGGSDNNALGLGQAVSYGIYADYQNNITLNDNTIKYIKPNGLAYGILASNGKIFNNDISLLSSATSYGIFNKGATIYNNMINLTDSIGTIYGIYNNANAQIDFNSIRISNKNQNSYCFYQDGLFNVRFTNNILTNWTQFQTPETKHFASFINVNNLFYNTSSIFNRNIYYVPYSTNGYLGYYDGYRTNLTSWQSATGNDQNSYFDNPHFTNSVNLHISHLQNTLVESRGRFIEGLDYTYITTDFDDNIRNVSTPDIGADENNFLPYYSAPFAASPYYPTDTATNIDILANPTLKWGNSFDEEHPLTWNEVYFSSNYDAVFNSEVSAKVLGNGSTVFEQYSHPTALLPNTTYYWRIVEHNSNAGTASLVHSFQTGTPYAGILTEDFETEMVPSNEWNRYYTSGANLDLNPANFMSDSGMGWQQAWDPSAIHSGTKAVRATNMTMPAIYWLVSPTITLNDSYTSNLKFWVKYNYTEVNPTYLHILIYADGGWHTLKAFTSAVDNNDYTIQENLSLETYKGKTVKVAFVYDNNPNSGNEVALDDISVAYTAHPFTTFTCQKTGNNLVLNWNAVTNATGYKIYAADNPAGPWTLHLNLPAASTTYNYPLTPAITKKFFRITALLPDELTK